MSSKQFIWRRKFIESKKKINSIIWFKLDTLTFSLVDFIAANWLLTEVLALELTDVRSGASP